MGNTVFTTRFVETFTYNDDSEDNYVYKSCLIESDFKNRIKKLMNIYNIIFQENQKGECKLTYLVTRLIIGSTTKHNIIPLIETHDEDNIKNCLKFVKNLKYLNNKYFTGLSQSNITTKTSEEIENSLHQLSDIDDTSINLDLEEGAFQNSLPNVDLSIIEIT